jgi:DNA-binding transcriptional MerR regulator
VADDKEEGAMLAIGELANRIGVPTHILRYWETRFPELKPLQRSGRRRYYRAEDVALAERIHSLLHEQGFTVEGARKALAGQGHEGEDRRAPVMRDSLDPVPQPAAAVRPKEASVGILPLIELRQRLARALEA